MLDKVAEVHHTSPIPKQLQDWVGHPLILPDGTIRGKYFQNKTMGGVVPFKFIYYPDGTLYPNPHFRIEVNPSMLLFVNNIQLLSDQSQIEESIYSAKKHLSIIPWIPDIDFGTGTLFRVDATYNHYIIGDIQDYLRAIYLLNDYPQRESRPWKYSGMQFYSKSTTCTFYDLFKKHRAPSAAGILRQETSMRGARNIADRMGIAVPTMREVTIDWLTDTLQHDLAVLHLDGTIITNRDLAAETLMNKYGVNKGKNLYGYLVIRQTMTKEQLMARGGKESTIRSWIQDIEAAGVALTMTDKVPLAPLYIQRKAQKSSGGTQ